MKNGFNQLLCCIRIYIIMRSNNLSKLANQINQNSQMKMHNEQYDTNLDRK